MRGAGGEFPELTVVGNKAVSSVRCSNADVKRIARESLLDALVEHILAHPEEAVLYCEGYPHTLPRLREWSLTQKRPECRPVRCYLSFRVTPDSRPVFRLKSGLRSFTLAPPKPSGSRPSPLPPTPFRGDGLDGFLGYRRNPTPPPGPAANSLTPLVFAGNQRFHTHTTLSAKRARVV